MKIIYRITDLGLFAKDFGLKDQIRRAAVSSMSNIAEGFARFHKKDFIRFLDISSSSVAEVKSLLYIALDLSYISEPQFHETQKLVAEAEQTTLGLLRYVKKTLEPKTNRIRAESSAYQSKFENNWLDLPEKFIES